jgi:uncharacterized RDD family membrane protein YckC
VLTPERVSLQYELAGIGSRGVALMIDTAIQVLVMVALVVSGIAAFAAAGAPAAAALEDSGEVGLLIVVAVLVVLLFGVTVGYFMLWESVWNGQTPGKRVMRLRVMRETGYPIRAGDAVVRNLVRIVDALPGGYAVGLLAMLLNARSKRLGDFAAGTIVVREGQRGLDVARLAGTRGGPEAVVGAPPPPAPARLRADDATLVRDFLLRRDGLDPRRRAALAARLARTLATAYGLDALRAASRSDESFLEDLV